MPRRVPRIAHLFYDARDEPGIRFAPRARLLNPDAYLFGILLRESVDTGPQSPVRGVQLLIQPVISQWATTQFIGIYPSGSFAKGTANRSGTDIDLFISLRHDTRQTLGEIYESLFKWLADRGYAPTRQNVSIHIKLAGYSVDLVPAKQQASLVGDHSLYRRKAGTWAKTNVGTHILHVLGGGRINETRILKLWRNQKRLEFPSFYLEMTVISALRGHAPAALSTNVARVFAYLRDNFPDARVVDPASSGNIISEDLTAAEKASIKAAATRALAAQNWNQIVV